jgi:hypothetical protein
MVAAIKLFRNMLEGRHFVVATDHKPLVQPPYPQQQPPGSFVGAFSGPGEAGKGSTEVMVPSGSQVPSPHARPLLPSLPVDLMALAAAQAECPDCQRATTLSSLQVTVVQMQGTSIVVDTSSGIFSPLVPAAFRRPIFDVIHSLAHPVGRPGTSLPASSAGLACFPGGGLVSRLPAVSASKGNKAAGGEASGHRQSCSALQSSSHRPDGATTHIQQRSHPLTDGFGPFQQMGGGIAAVFHLGGKQDRRNQFLLIWIEVGKPILLEMEHEKILKKREMHC